MKRVLATAGHVDHGKSTLVGRLLADTGVLGDGKLEKVQNTCRRQGKTFEYAFLLDALEAAGVEEGLHLSTQQEQVFSRAARYLSERVASLPYGFVHRDYQSRNLMLVERPGLQTPELVWIDFQDALCGPRVYDLVALLHDSYQDLSEAFIQARLAEYCELRGIEEPGSVRREFDLVTAQRKLKDAGRFVYFERRTGDASYLCFVQPSVLKVRKALARLDEAPELRELAALLDDKFACAC